MVTRNSYSSERRLMIDMAAIRELYRRKEIDGVAHIPGKTNLADVMTKIVQSPELLDLMQGEMTLGATHSVMRGDE